MPNDIRPMDGPKRRRSPVLPILVTLILALAIGGLVWYLQDKRAASNESPAGKMSRRTPVTVGVEIGRAHV